MAAMGRRALLVLTGFGVAFALLFGGGVLASCGSQLAGAAEQDVQAQSYEVSADGLPEWFSAELFLPSGAQELRATSSGDVVGFCKQGAQEDVARELSLGMEEKGWTEVRTGVEGCSTFMKEEGSCRWVQTSCVQVGPQTSVVLRCVAPGGSGS